MQSEELEHAVGFVKEEPQEPDTEICAGCYPGKHFLWKECVHEENDRGRR